MRDFMEGILGISIIVLILGSIFGGSFAIAYFSSRATCNGQCESIGYEHKYDYWGGCLININGSWIPLDRYIFPELQEVK